MKVILLKDVSKLGKRYDVKEVTSGHALNMLIPRGFAVSATPDAIKRFDIEKKKIDGGRKVQEDLVAKNIKDLESLTLTVKGKANDKGHLFAGLHREEIAAEIAKQTQLQVDPSFIMLEHPIKEVGEHKIDVMAAGKKASFMLIVQKI